MRVSRSDRGSAMLLCIIILIILVGISGAYLSFSLINTRKTNEDMFALQALYIAESGASIMLRELSGTTNNPQVVNNPIAIGGGEFTVPVVENYGADGVDNDKNGVLDGQDPYEQNFYRVEIEGVFTDTTRRLELILSRDAGGAFWNAIFAGNSSGDPAYTMDFGGTGTSADLVQGDIYVGGDINVTGAAALLNEDGSGVSNQVMYENSYSDSSSAANPNYVQGNQQPLDITRDASQPKKTEYEVNAEKAFSQVTSSADYANLDYVHVTNELDSSRASKGTIQNEDWTTGTNYRGGIGGSNCGYATQITDKNNPAHWFRLEPYDMTGPQTHKAQNRAWTYTKTNTGKRDYFIEDPTEDVRSGNISTDANAQMLDIGANGNEKVYFVDGNLWAANAPTYTFKFKHADPTMKVTVVVKGNIYWTDNLYYQNNQEDAVAFIAVKDDDYPSLSPTDFLNSSDTLPHAVGSDTTMGDFASSIGADLSTPAGREAAAREYNRIHGSGNILFGDPGGGTVENFEAYQYAENNFYDNNLGGSGTKLTKIFGNMTAGNQIVIKRNTSGGYKPMEVRFDDKIRTGKVAPPDLPATPGFGSGDWFVASWKQVP